MDDEDQYAEDKRQFQAYEILRQRRGNMTMWAIEFSDIVGRMAIDTRLIDDEWSFPMFWIRLQGMIDEFPIALQFQLDCLDASVQGGVPEIGEMLAFCAKLKGLFNEDELALIRFRRTAECHPYQAKFEPLKQAKGGARLIAQDEEHWQDLMPAIYRELMKRGDITEHARTTAIAFARRIAPYQFDMK